MAINDYGETISGEIDYGERSFREILAPRLINDHIISLEDINDLDLEREFDEIMECEDRVYSGFINVMTAVAVMNAQGHTKKQIIERFPILNRKRLSKIMMTDAYKDIILALTQEAVKTSRTFMQSASLRATKALMECLESPNEKIKFEAAKDILNRVGLKSAEVHVISDKRDYTPTNVEEELKKFDGGMEEVRKSLRIVADLRAEDVKEEVEPVEHNN